MARGEGLLGCDETEREGRARVETDGITIRCLQRGAFSTPHSSLIHARGDFYSLWGPVPYNIVKRSQEKVVLRLRYRSNPITVSKVPSHIHSAMIPEKVRNSFVFNVSYNFACTESSLLGQFGAPQTIAMPL